MSRRKILHVDKSSFNDVVDSFFKAEAAKETIWGWHLICDMEGCDAKIDDEATVKDFIKKLVKKLKMTAVGDPIIKKFGKGHIRDLSAMQLITTSTITYHADKDGWKVFLDVFSCREYDYKLVFPLVKEHFKPEKMSSIFIIRRGGSIKVNTQDSGKLSVAGYTE